MARVDRVLRGADLGWRACAVNTRIRATVQRDIHHACVVISAMQELIPTMPAFRHIAQSQIGCGFSRHWGTTMLIEFPKRNHVWASAGHKSGRKSDLGIPVACSIDKTNSAGTPLLERVSQYQTCDCVVPIRSAKGFCPPATSQARFKASLDMAVEYLKLGDAQQKNLCKTPYLSFGNVDTMKKAVDKKAFGERVAWRRTKLKLSQGALAKAVGMRQQGVQNIEAGIVARPRAMMELATVLETTEKWLLWKEGPEVPRKKAPAKELQEINDTYQSLSPEGRSLMLRFSRSLRKDDDEAA